MMEVIKSRQPDRKWWALPAFLVAGSLLVGAFLDAQIRLEMTQSGRGAGYRLLYLPNGKYLKTVSLGFSEVMADVIYLWSIQFYSGERRAEHAEYLEHIYGSVLAELDPHYLDPYLTGAMIMALEGNDVEMALRLLDLGMANNPDSWILAADAGFYAFLQLGDFERAEAYFRRAVDIPGAPQVLARMSAGMADKRGAKRDAYLAWLEIYETADDDYTRTISFRHVHDLKIELDVERLQFEVTDFRRRNGRFPDSLEILVESGRLPSIPTDPQQLPYLYDAETGRVSCITPYALKRGV
jgi:tetratricopeptide (TPR) repeat protein